MEAAHRSASPDPRDPLRIAALYRAAMLETPVDEGFDRITRLAARSLGAPVALVNIVDGHLESCRSAYDETGRYQAGAEGPLTNSICRHVIADGTPVVLEDARAHPEFSDMPAVRLGRVVAYAGVPIVTHEGHVLGSLCVIQQAPRAWTDRETEILRDLAQALLTEVELRADVILRQEAEDALRVTRDRLRIILQDAALGIALVDLTGRPVEVNPALERMLGYTAQELRRKTFHQLTHPEDVAIDGLHFADMIRGERDHYQIDKRYIRKDGSVVWGRLNVSAAKDVAGLPRYVLAMVEDLTQRQELEALRAEVRILEGMLPICMFCKKIRNDSEEWERLEAYISHRSEATFTHGCCPECEHTHFRAYFEGR